MKTKRDQWADEIAGLFFDQYITTSEGRAENTDWFQAKAVALMAFEKCREEILKLQSPEPCDCCNYRKIQQLGHAPAEEDLKISED